MLWLFNLKQCHYNLTLGLWWNNWEWVLIVCVWTLCLTCNWEVQHAFYRRYVVTDVITEVRELSHFPEREAHYEQNRHAGSFAASKTFKCFLWQFSPSSWWNVKVLYATCAEGTVVRRVRPFSRWRANEQKVIWLWNCAASRQLRSWRTHGSPLLGTLVTPTGDVGKRLLKLWRRDYWKLCQKGEDELHIQLRLQQPQVNNIRPV